MTEQTARGIEETMLKVAKGYEEVWYAVKNGLQRDKDFVKEGEEPGEFLVTLFNDPADLLEFWSECRRVLNVKSCRCVFNEYSRTIYSITI